MFFKQTTYIPHICKRGSRFCFSAHRLFETSEAITDTEPQQSLLDKAYCVIGQILKDPPWYASLRGVAGSYLPVKGCVIIDARKELCYQISLLPRKTGATYRLLTRRCIHYLIGSLHLMSFFCWILVTRFLYIPRPAEVTPLRWAWLTITKGYTCVIV